MKKFVINVEYGGFELPEEWLEAHGYEDEYEVGRDDPDLVKAVEDGLLPHLSVVTVPEEATDTLLNEYDGAEELYYVLDGKIYIAD